MIIKIKTTVNQYAGYDQMNNQLFYQDIEATESMLQFLGLCHAIFTADKEVAIFTNDKFAMQCIKNGTYKTSYTQHKKAVDWINSSITKLSKVNIIPVGDTYLLINKKVHVYYMEGII